VSISIHKNTARTAGVRRHQSRDVTQQRCSEWRAIRSGDNARTADDDDDDDGR